MQTQHVRAGIPGEQWVCCGLLKALQNVHKRTQPNTHTLSLSLFLSLSLSLSLPLSLPPSLSFSLSFALVLSGQRQTDDDTYMAPTGAVKLERTIKPTMSQGQAKSLLQSHGV